MTILRTVLSCLLVVIAIGAAGVYAGDAGSIYGLVQGAEGQPIAGATLTLTSSQNPAAVMRTTTDDAGRYVFAGVAIGEYHEFAVSNGFEPPASQLVTISATKLHVKIDFQLRRLEGTTDPHGAGAAEPPLKFEAAGVRGLIDPGGYSAPANAAAATVLIKGIADIKRGARDQGAAAAAAALPCGLGPELRAAEQANPGSAAAKQKLGNFYVAHDETEKGIALLEQAQALERSEAAIALDLATARIRNGEFDAARQLLKGLEPRMRSDAVLHQLLARADEGSGMFREAAAEYQAAAQEQPSEDYLFGVGYEFILAGLPADATSAFRSGLQGHPDSVELLIGEGSAEFLQGKTSEGIAHFLRATEINPADPRAYVFLASVAEIRRPESDKIRDSFRRFLDVAPDNVDASYDYALSLWVARDANTPLTDDVKNEELLKRAIQLSPSFAKAHFRLGTLYFERGDYPGAVREYEATVRLAPAMKEAHYRLANAYQRIGQSEGAAREMRLFQAAQDQQRQEAAAGISIQQFVSVLTPARETTSSKLSCTEPLR